MSVILTGQKMGFIVNRIYLVNYKPHQRTNWSPTEKLPNIENSNVRELLNKINQKPESVNELLMRIIEPCTNAHYWFDAEMDNLY